MAVAVFISWSGDLSAKLAKELRDWLPQVLQSVKPYLSFDDIEKGARWFSEITQELKSTSVGVICLTPDNTERPWLLFEAGALSKDLDKSRVCPIFFGFEPTDIKGPLTNFQATKFNRIDFLKLATTINNLAGDSKLSDKNLEASFEKWWPDLEKAVQKIMTARVPEKVKPRTDREILEEILEKVRGSSYDRLQFFAGTPLSSGQILGSGSIESPYQFVYNVGRGNQIGKLTNLPVVELTKAPFVDLTSDAAENDNSGIAAHRDGEED